MTVKIDQVSWNEYSKDIDTLIGHIQKRRNHYYEAVVGIPRGGLIAAVIISHKMNIPYKPIDQLEGTHKVLIVDDLVESGATLIGTKKTLLMKDIKCDVAIVYAKGSSQLHLVDFYSKIKDPADWILHPFEDVSRVMQDFKEYYARFEGE